MASNIVTSLAYDAIDSKLFLGTHHVVGVAPDSKFVLTRNNDLVIPQVGVDGDVALSLSRNRTGTLTINLLGVSDTNQYLSLFARSADTTGIVCLPILLTGATGAPSFSGIGWIQGIPEVTYGEEAPTLSWTFGIANAFWTMSETTTVLGTITDVVNEIAGTNF